MRTTEMISAPIAVRQMLPTPPVIAVPPTTTAAIDGSSSSLASVGEPDDEPAAQDDAGEPGEGARQRQARTFCRSTLTPEA